MKSILHNTAILVILLFLGIGSSCSDEDSQDPSKITYFTLLELNGDNPLFVEQGTPFVDPGVVATEGDADVSKSVVTMGEVDNSTIGLYTLTYSAKNVDGFANSIDREVFVYNPSIKTDISGVYTAIQGTCRITMGSGASVDYGGYSVTISALVSGIFAVSDLLGGYYDQGRGYGADYAMMGYLSLNSDNTLSLLYSYTPGFGDTLDEIKDGKYDPTTHTVSWDAYYAGQFIFRVIIKLNN